MTYTNRQSPLAIKSALTKHQSLRTKHRSASTAHHSLL